MRAWLEKCGTAGSVIAATACPICFPKLALLGSLVGLGALGAYEASFFIAVQVLVGVAVVGQALSFRRHRNFWILGTAVMSAGAVFSGLYLVSSELLVYAGFSGLVGTSFTEFWMRRAGREFTASRKGAYIGSKARST